MTLRSKREAVAHWDIITHNAVPALPGPKITRVNYSGFERVVRPPAPTSADDGNGREGGAEGATGRGSWSGYRFNGMTVTRPGRRPLAN